MAIHYFTKGIKAEIGENIARIRKKKNLKVIEVAEAAGINRSYYRKIERGLVNPSIEKLYKIVKTLGTTSQEILPF